MKGYEAEDETMRETSKKKETTLGREYSFPDTTLTQDLWCKK